MRSVIPSSVTILFFIAALLGCVGSLFAQEGGCWRRLANGNNVYQIAEEGDAIWASTGSGLAKIDKATFAVLELYNEENSALPGYAPTCLAIDAQGNKWVGISRVGVGKLTGNQWHIFDTLNSPLRGLGHFPPSVTQIFAASDGKIWIGTSNNGVYSLDGDLWAHYRSDNSPLPHNWINHIQEDADGAIWFGVGLMFSSNVGLAVLHPDGTWEVFTSANSGLPASAVTSVLIDDEGVVWAGTTKGLARYDGVNWSTFFPNSYVFSLALNAAGHLFVGMGNGLVKKYDRVSVWEDYPVPTIATYNSQISDLLVDANQNLWVVSFAISGLFRLGATGWIEITPIITGLELSPIHSITQTADGHYWMGTSYLGLFEWTGSDWTHHQNFFSPLPDHHFVQLIQRQGKMILGKHMGLSFEILEWDGATETPLFSQSGSSANPAFLTEFALDGDVLWVSSTRGLHRYDGAWMHYNTSNSGLPTNTIRDMKLHQGIIWAATPEGLARFDGSQWVVWDTSTSALPLNSLRFLSVDDEGHLWILAGGASNYRLFKFMDGDFQEFTPPFQGVTTVYDMLVKNEQEMFFADYSGIYTNVSGEWILRNTSLAFALFSDGHRVLVGSQDGLTIFAPDCSFPSSVGAPILPPVQVTAFPNPATEEITFRLTGEMTGTAAIEIFDAGGKMQMKIRQPIGNGQLHANIRQLPAGIYFYIIKSEKFFVTGKFVKQL
jgi:ligand-binding sensor domain-containing protein